MGLEPKRFSDLGFTQTRKGEQNSPLLEKKINDNYFMNLKVC